MRVALNLIALSAAVVLLTAGAVYYPGACARTLVLLSCALLALAVLPRR